MTISNIMGARGIGRRSFLKTTAAAGAALCAPGLMRRSYAQGAKPFTVWVWGGPDRFDGRLNTFNTAYPGEVEQFDIDVRSPGAHDAEVYQQLRLAMASRSDVPDLVMMNYIAVPEFSETGILSPLGDFYGELADDLTSAGRSLTTYNDELMAIPANLNVKTWFYHKEMFDAAGIDPLQIRTADDYMAAGRRFREAHPDAYIMNIGDTPIHYWYFMMLSHWDDLTMANRDGTYNITSDPRFGEVLSWMHDWRHSGISMPIDDWSPDWQPGFQNGRIGGTLIGSWMLGFLARFAPEQGGQWGMAPWPDFNNAGSEAGGAVFVIPELAQNKENAFEFMSKLHLQAQGSVTDWSTRGTIPGIQSAVSQVQELSANPERPEGLTDEEWQVTPANFYGPGFMDPIIASMENFQVFNYDPMAQAQLDIMRRRTEAYIANRASLDEALDGMEADMERQLGNPYDV